MVLPTPGLQEEACLATKNVLGCRGLVRWTVRVLTTGQVE